MTMRIRSYSELRRLETLEDRFEYLKLGGSVGKETFGFDRWVNQLFYRSPEWRSIRHHVIVRDLGCDLGIKGHEIHKYLYIHHLNPITLEQIQMSDETILDPEFLITTTRNTHNAIHYGDASLLPSPVKERSPGDTKLW